MPRRKVPGADYASPTIDLRELPNDMEEQGRRTSTSEPMLDIRTLHNNPMPQLLKIAAELDVEGAPALRKQELIFEILQAQTERAGSSSRKGSSRSCPTASASCGRPTTTTSPGPTTSTSRPRRSALRPAHRRHDLGPDPPAEGGGALLRPHQGRGGQLRGPRRRARQDPLRQPDAALPAGADPARDADEHVDAHHRPDRARSARGSAA